MRFERSEWATRAADAGWPAKEEPTRNTLTIDAESVTSLRATANLLWVSNDRSWVRVESLWGQRQNLVDQAARARRIQFGVQYNF
jgi:hypothetical protein